MYLRSLNSSTRHISNSINNNYTIDQILLIIWIHIWITNEHSHRILKMEHSLLITGNAVNGLRILVARQWCVPFQFIPFHSVLWKLENIFDSLFFRWLMGHQGHNLYFLEVSAHMLLIDHRWPERTSGK